jgi:anti-anti-sigma factor
MNPSIHTMQIRGRLDAHQSTTVEKDIEEAVHAGRHHIRVSLKEVAFLSSAGIRVLLKYYQQLTKLGGSFAVVDPSPPVEEVLRLSGLDRLVAPADGGAGTLVTRAGTRDPATARTFEGMSGQVTAMQAAAPLQGRMFGTPALLDGGGFAGANAAKVRFPDDTFGFGLGAMGSGFDDCRDRFGEFLAVAGTLACLPADRPKSPDYLLAREALVPEVLTLYSLVCQGSFAARVRFDSQTADGRGTRLSSIVNAAFDLCGSDAVAWVLLAESTGLVGASLRWSPVGPGPDGGAWRGFPGVRDRLMFTPEAEFDRHLALVAGVAVARPRPDLAPFVRPLVKGRDFPAGHSHAAVFHYRALPRVEIDLKTFLPSLYEDEKLVTVMHLLNDHREIAGAGESCFRNGTFWVAPLGPVLPGEGRTGQAE